MLKLVQFLILIGLIETVLIACPYSYSGLQKLSLLSKDKTDFKYLRVCLFNTFRSVEAASVTSI